MEQGDAISRSAVLEKLNLEFDLAAEERADTDDEKEMAFNSGEMNCARRVTRFVKELNALDVPFITGETSDGYHTFNELYHHRAVLFSVIVKAFPDRAWKARKHHDGSMYDGMFIVGIETPDGQATYHYDIEPYWDMFQCKELEYAPEWDGHTPAQAIDRIGKLEPVRHGRWVLEAHDERVNCRWNVTAECSECCDDRKEIWTGFFPGVPPSIARCVALESAESVKLSNYCPNCGAKMDGGKDDENA